jgi:PPK2 family polyphosphate:nucleotide phosphotransferase
MGIKLKDISTRAPKDLVKEEVKQQTQAILEKLDDLQNLLYAASQHSVLVILQGMDASGKDGAIRNVFSAVNPQGVRVTSFKAPSKEELSHDFLWRIHCNVPAKGMIGIFNRSQYEDVLITRVHKWIDDKTAKRRMKAINDLESLLQEHNQTTILKFYLHISPEEQQQRLQERISNPAKQWKYNPADMEEAKFWNDYRDAYEDCFEHCNDVPWTIVPADQNWYKEYVIAHTLLKALEKLDMKYPALIA